MTDSDPIAEAVLSESTYARLRAGAFVLLRSPIPRKIAWQSYLLFALAALFPISGLLPSGVRRAYLPEIALASPRWTTVALVAAGIVWVTGLGHAGVGLGLLRIGPAITEFRAREFLSLEKVFSTLGFGTGGIATLLAYALVALGFGGVDLVTASARVVSNPFAPAPDGVTIAVLAVGAMVGAVLLKFLSAFVYVESLRRGRPDVHGRVP